MAPISADDVLRYLEENPGFFMDHPEAINTSQLLDSDAPPDSVLNIRHRLFDRLNEERTELTRFLEETIDVVRQNEQIEANFLAIEKLIFDPSPPETALPRIAEEIERRFGLDHVSFLMTNAVVFDPLSMSRQGNMERIRIIPNEEENELAGLADGILLTGHLEDGASPLFPENSRADLTSTAVVRLQQGGQILGLLLLGSKDPKRYEKEMATQLLERLAVRLSIGIRLLQLLGTPSKKGSGPSPKSEAQIANQSA
jgi:uncharacterized protein YigA (DUF484 family)